MASKTRPTYRTIVEFIIKQGWLNDKEEREHLKDTLMSVVAHLEMWDQPISAAFKKPEEWIYCDGCMEKNFPDASECTYCGRRLRIRAEELAKSEYPEELVTKPECDYIKSGPRYGTHYETIPHDNCQDPAHCDCICEGCMRDWRKAGQPGREKPPSNACIPGPNGVCQSHGQILPDCGERK